MMDKPVISVIVPVYKTEAYLDECLQSLVAQTLREIEIILVDDGSPDRCPQMCDAWAKRDPRIRVIHQENAGLSDARNSGIRAASADYLMFCDSDDYVSPDFCGKPLALVRDTGCDMVIFDFLKTDESGQVLAHQDARMRCEGRLDRESALSAMASKKMYEYAWNKLYPRAYFRDILFPSGESWEDMAVMYELVACADNVFCTKEPLYYYRQREGSLATENWESAFEDVLARREEACRFLKEACPGAEPFMQASAAHEEIRFMRTFWRRKDKRKRYLEVRRSLRSRRFSPEHMPFRVERVLLRLAPLPPALFGASSGAVLRLYERLKHVREKLGVSRE